MSRPLRIEYPDAVYHVTARGNAKENIFQSDSDREVFLKIFSGVVRRFNCKRLANPYCQSLLEAVVSPQPAENAGVVL